MPRARSYRLGAAAVALVIAALAGACTSSHSTTVTPGPKPPPVAKVAGLWKPILDENFSGKSLDTNRWEPGWFGVGMTPSVNANDGDLTCANSSQVTVAGGMLQLTTKRANVTCGDPPVKRHFVSGVVSSNNATTALGPGKGFTFQYGLIEFRAKIPGDSRNRCADWPSLFTTGQRWPDTGELDAFECLGSGSTWALHTGLTGGASPYVPGYPKGNWTGWHTFAIDWEPNTATIYFDGREVGAHNYIVPHRNYIVITNEVRKGSEVVLPSTLDVDWVRVWQHSSASTARPIVASAAGLSLATASGAPTT